MESNLELSIWSQKKKSLNLCLQTMKHLPFSSLLSLPEGDGFLLPRTFLTSGSQVPGGSGASCHWFCVDTKRRGGWTDPALQSAFSLGPHSGGLETTPPPSLSRDMGERENRPRGVVSSGRPLALSTGGWPEPGLLDSGLPAWIRLGMRAASSRLHF